MWQVSSYTGQELPRNKVKPISYKFYLNQLGAFIFASLCKHFILPCFQLGKQGLRISQHGFFNTNVAITGELDWLSVG